MIVCLQNTVIILLLIGCGLGCTDGKKVSGTLTTKEDWAFLARFCFLSTGRGAMYFKFTYPKEYGVQNILLYFDSDEQWSAVYKTDTNCTQKEGALIPQNNQIIRLSTDERWSGCIEKDEYSYECKGGRIFRSTRERWWFIVVSNCQSTKGIELEYEINMTNAEEDDLFFHHFSADEFYILQSDIAFIILYVAMLLFSCYVAYMLRCRQLFHTTYKMYMASIAAKVIELFFMCIAYGDYAKSGEEDSLGVLKLLARIFGSVSILVFLLMLILMGKGYTITRGRLSSTGSIKIAIFMTIYVVVYAVLFIYEAKFFDPGEVLYLYESPAGYGLIAMRIIGWIWFVYAIAFTLKHYPEKSSFFYPFATFYTIWFFAMPVIVLAGHFLIPKYMREKVVNGIEMGVAFISHVVFLILTRPSAANSNFPYHVRTTQIGILSSPSESGSESSQTATAMADTGSFPSSSYSVSADCADENGMEKNFSTMFITSQTSNNNSKSFSLDHH